MKRNVIIVAFLILSSILMTGEQGVEPQTKTPQDSDRLAWAMKHIQNLRKKLSDEISANDGLREEMSGLRRENKELRQELVEWKKRSSKIQELSEFLCLKPKLNADSVDILDNIHSYILSNSRPVKKISLLSDEDWRWLSLAFEDDPILLKKIKDYEKTVKEFAGKKIIILEK